MESFLFLSGLLSREEPRYSGLLSRFASKLLFLAVEDSTSFNLTTAFRLFANRGSLFLIGLMMV
jgi:hypothetical protein